MQERGRCLRLSQDYEDSFHSQPLLELQQLLLLQSIPWLPTTISCQGVAGPPPESQIRCDAGVNHNHKHTGPLQKNYCAH